MVDAISSPTRRADVLAVPTRTTFVAPSVMVPSVAFEIVSSFVSVITPAEVIDVVAVPPTAKVFDVKRSAKCLEDVAFPVMTTASPTALPSVTAPFSVVASSTFSVPAVSMLVLMVVAALTPPTTKKTPTTTAMTIFSKLLSLISESAFFININDYCQFLIIISIVSIETCRPEARIYFVSVDLFCPPLPFFPKGVDNPAANFDLVGRNFYSFCNKSGIDFPISALSSRPSRVKYRAASCRGILLLRTVGSQRSLLSSTVGGNRGGAPPPPPPPPPPPRPPRAT